MGLGIPRRRGDRLEARAHSGPCVAGAMSRDAPGTGGAVTSVSALWCELPPRIILRGGSFVLEGLCAS